MKKGQAAIEFLMTYGWAILVVLAAVAALAYFGVLSPDRFLPEQIKCEKAGGEWKELTFTCGDLCKSSFSSCDCGEDKCWNPDSKECEVG